MPRRELREGPHLGPPIERDQPSLNPRDSAVGMSPIMALTTVLLLRSIVGAHRRPTAGAESPPVPSTRDEPLTSARGTPAPPNGTQNVRAEIERAWEILGRLNALPPGDFGAMRALLGELTGRALDPSVRVLPPFHSDGGRNLRFGRNVFVNHGCTAMDFGGIDIGDDVLIGPNVQLLSSGHPLDPATRRRSITTAPIRIGRGVWIAAGATILQGVTVGDDAVVAAGAVVTKDVPPRTLVAGVPARAVRAL
jgi:acetyltransferase-like isoleucine patch superfamily enzyme